MEYFENPSVLRHVIFGRGKLSANWARKYANAVLLYSGCQIRHVSSIEVNEKRTVGI